MCIGISVVDTFGYVARIQGTSMQPTFNNETGQADYVFVNNLATRINGIQRGDIVSFISPKSPNERLIKRVIAISNDTVYTRGYKWPVLKVPEGYAWVEGDHKEGSMDSNVFGPIPIGLITAKVTYIVWPPKRWQYLHSFIPEPNQPLLLQNVLNSESGIS
ncbi:hypothetical protein KM043_004614 [Ampulex compressa]|nr:hypothetical protein KM043_004614 [Ampulex compressa]